MIVKLSKLSTENFGNVSYFNVSLPYKLNIKKDGISMCNSPNENTLLLKQIVTDDEK